MTEQQHQITPPPKIFKQWEDDILNERDNVDHVLDCAWRNGFQAGADQELEACISVVLSHPGFEQPELFVELLRAKRRPRPLSLMELALASVKRLEESGEFFSDQMRELEFIRKALEQFND